MGICYGTPVDDSRSKPPSPGFTHANRDKPRKLESNNCKTGDHNGSEAAGRKTCGDDDRRASCEEKTKMTSNVASSGQITITAPNPKLNSNTTEMKMFRFQDLRAATRNFRPDTILGEGGFGRVFKGWVDPVSLSPAKVGLGIPVAVKKSNPDSQQGLQEWQAEVMFLGKFCHPNLVKLIGYCWEDNQFLLVYEYMQKGSLENHLFRKGAEPFPWELRLKIAIDAAKGLSFLHCSEKSVIYRDFKASNILLDESYNAKLSDFGLAKFGPIDGNSHVTTRLMGTYGYTAPEYVATGHLYVKSDVYGFGVVLLEMLTGLRALDTNRPSGQHNLVDYARPSLTDKRKLKKIMDPRLEGEYPIEAALLAAQLITQCFEAEPKNRPSMEHVLQTLQTVSLIEIEPKKKKKKRRTTKKNTTTAAAATARSKNNQRRLPADHDGASPLHSKHHGHGLHHNGTRSRPHRY